MQEQIVPDQKNRLNRRIERGLRARHGLLMKRDVVLDDTYDERVIQRVEALLKDMGWTSLDLAKRIYERMGYGSPKAVDHWFSRKESRKLSNKAVIAIADELGVNAGYIILEHDNLEGTLDPEGKYALRRQVRRLGGT